MAQEYWAENDEYNNNYEEDNQDWSIKPIPSSLLSTSMNHFPGTLLMEEQSKLRYGLMVTPLAETPEPLPKIRRLSRCLHCRCYINPYVEIITNGMRHYWSCNLCGATNDTTKEHYEAYLNGECPEMQHCAYDILAPKEWLNAANPLQSPHYLFVIHTNKELVETGVFAMYCQTIKQAINSDETVFAYSKTAKVGFMTFSNKVQYYYLSSMSTTAKPKIFEPADINDVVLPIDPHTLMLNVHENLDEINAFLDMLPTMFAAKDCSNENALGTAMQCALFIMQKVGGKCIVLSHNLASLGKGKVMNRSGSAADLLQPANDYYCNLTELIAGPFQISIDLFQTLSNNNQFCDMATLKGVCHKSGGKCHFYSDLRRECENMCNDLYKLLSREHGWHGTLRMRLSKGIYSARKWMANYGRNKIKEAELTKIEQQSCPLLCLSTFDSDKTLTITLSNRNDGDENWVQTEENTTKINSQFAYCQIGLLFTSQQNFHTVRILTLQIPLTLSYKALYDGINVNVMSALTAKQACYRMLSGEYGEARLFIQRSCVQACIAYSKNVDANCTFQNINEYLPSMRNWPLMILGLLKCRAFAPMQNVARWDSIDQRGKLFMDILDMNATTVELMTRPSLYRMDDIIHLEDESLEDEYWIPEERQLTLRSISADGMYLVNNGQDLMIFIGPSVHSDVIQTFLQRKDGFGLVSLMDAEENKYAQKFHSILQYLQAINYRYQSIKFISSNDDSTERTKAFYATYLIHDRTDSIMSYQEFLTFIHQQVQKNIMVRRGGGANQGLYYD